MSAVHHHDFGYRARKYADSGSGGKCSMMIRTSGHDRVRPMSNRLHPCARKSARIALPVSPSMSRRRLDIPPG